ncbi:MAG: hypothetical protein FJ291_06180 [Planctomycetes bacterium]|nr:hypothetical protein [Planctomycetota bacterium]
MAGGVLVDLSRLCEMHPRVPADMGAMMALRAALGLQRNGHSPGARLQMLIESARLRGALAWLVADLRALEQHDSKRVTEDGAEAIALAVAHETKEWHVVRRLQQGESADWLLEHRGDKGRKLVAFEIGGTDSVSIARTLREKRAQVAKSVDVDQRCAGVVGFKRPQATLESVEARTHDH